MGLLPLTDERADGLLAEVPEPRRRECWWLVLPDRSLVPGDRGGAITLLAAMRRTRWAGRGLRWLRLSRPINVLDHWLARTRQHLGRFVPDGAAPVRFP